MKAIALNCTLKTGFEQSSTEKLLKEVAAELKKERVDCEIIRITDFNIKPGVRSDEGHGDEWPPIRQKILDADILIIGTPIWMGQPGSVAKRVLERMDAFLSEKDDEGRMVSYGKIAGVAVVGNEDGAHHVCAELFQSLNDVGFTIPANACTYWVGEAMGKIDYKDLEETPEKTAEATKMMVGNLVHIAKMLGRREYPAQQAA